MVTAPKRRYCRSNVIGTSCSVSVFWAGAVLPESVPVTLLAVCRSCVCFGNFSLKKYSFVFLNSKSLFNAIGSGVTFSTILGSSTAPAQKSLKTRNRPNAEAANLIHTIKPDLECGVNPLQPGSRGWMDLAPGPKLVFSPRIQA